SDGYQDLVVAYVTDAAIYVPRFSILLNTNGTGFVESQNFQIMDASGQIRKFTLQKCSEYDDYYHIFAITITPQGNYSSYMIQYSYLTDSYSTTKNMDSAFGMVRNFISWDYDLDGLPDLLIHSNPPGDY